MQRSELLSILGAFVLGGMLVAGATVAALPAAGDAGPNAVFGSATPSSHGAPTTQTLQAGARAPSQTIQVAASGQSSAQPDTAAVRVAVRARASNVTDARTWVAENASKMRSALLDAGFAESQIRTTDFDVREERRHREREDRPPAYVASHDFVIEVTDVERVGPAIDTAITNGATSIQGVEFLLSEETRRELRERALTDAVDSARTQADVLAQRANLTITGVHSITTNDVRYRRETALAAGGDGGGAASTDIDAGPVTVTASVQVAYNATG